jgi:hypothetical protein
VLEDIDLPNDIVIQAVTEEFSAVPIGKEKRSVELDLYHRLWEEVNEFHKPVLSCLECLRCC